MQDNSVIDRPILVESIYRSIYWQDKVLSDKECEENKCKKKRIVMAENSARSQYGVIRFLSSSQSSRSPSLVHADLMSLLAFAISVIYRISKSF